jgi:hypothetical protein
MSTKADGRAVREGVHAGYPLVLSVWNTRDTEDVLGPFNVMRALAGWDREHRAAFVEWARAPWWP